MAHSNRCRPRSLVRGRIARVDWCADCRRMSVHVGPTTVRMDEHTLRCLWVTIGDALEAMEDSPVRVTSALRGQA